MKIYGELESNNNNKKGFKFKFNVTFISFYTRLNILIYTINSERRKNKYNNLNNNDNGNNDDTIRKLPLDKPLNH